MSEGANLGGGTEESQLAKLLVILGLANKKFYIEALKYIRLWQLTKLITPKIKKLATWCPHPHPHRYDS